MDEDQKPRKIVYTAEPTPAKFHASNAFFRGLRGPVGSSKTSACIMELYTRALEQKPFENVRRSRWVLVRNTYPELLSTTLKTFQDWIPAELCPITRSPSLIGKMELNLDDRTSVEAEFLFLALDTEDDANKLKSLEVTGAFINEASEIRESVLKLLTSRVGRAPSPAQGGASWSGIIADTNSPPDDHWWYRLAEVEKPQGYAFFNQPPAMLKCYYEDKSKPAYYIPNDGSRKGVPPAENIRNLPNGFTYYERQVPGKDSDWIKVFLLNEYGSLVTGKPVFPEYSDPVHFSREELKPYPGLPLLIGQDFGLTPACVIGQETPRGQFRVLDELVSEGMGVERFARDLLTPKLHSQKYLGCIPYIIGDPAGSQRSQTNETTCFDILELQGFRVEPAPSNEFLMRRESVAWFLTKLTDGMPGLIISNTCHILRKAMMGGYKYRKMRVGGLSDKFAETPEKNEFSHVADALQYACSWLRSAGMERESALAPVLTSARRKVKIKSPLAYS